MVALRLDLSEEFVPDRPGDDDNDDEGVLGCFVVMAGANEGYIDTEINDC